MGRDHGVEFASLERDTADAVAQTMQALAAPSRVRILSRLAAGPCSVTALAHDVGMGQPAVSQQLRVLRYLGLVVGARDGRRIVYSLHDDHVRALLGEAISHAEHIGLGTTGQTELTAIGA